MFHIGTTPGLIGEKRDLNLRVNSGYHRHKHYHVPHVPVTQIQLSSSCQHIVDTI